MPPDRVKPWGTAHATLTSRSEVHTPFAVINADDFYGAESFRVLARFLTQTAPVSPDQFAMVGFQLDRTLSEHGTVARGLCQADAEGYLTSIEELTAIEKQPGGARNREADGSYRPLTGQEIVSMNCWALPPATEARQLPPEQVTLLSTGSQGEPLSALTRIAMNDHKQVKIEAGDTVIMSSRIIPGNERVVSRLISNLYRRGCQVLHPGLARVHVSGHASQEEMKLLLHMVSPRYFIPIHGELRHLHQHGRIAGPPSRYDYRNFSSGDGLGASDHFFH